MCRNIKVLFNFEPSATNEEIKLAALQFVRKITGFNKPSAINRHAFNRAVEEIATSSSRLLNSLVTLTPKRSGESDVAKAHARSARRSVQSRVRKD